MQHPLREARQPRQSNGLVQIAVQRRDALGTQCRHALGRAGQRQHAHAMALRGRCRQRMRHPLPDIATAHNQQAGTAETRWQRTEWILV